MPESIFAAVCGSVDFVDQGLCFLQADVSGLDARMVALAGQQGQLQAALHRKHELAEQLTEVRPATRIAPNSPNPRPKTLSCSCMLMLMPAAALFKTSIYVKSCTCDVACQWHDRSHHTAKAML